MSDDEWVVDVDKMEVKHHQKRIHLAFKPLYPHGASSTVLDGDDLPEDADECGALKRQAYGALERAIKNAPTS